MYICLWMNKFTQHSNGYFCSLSCSPSRLLLFLLFYFAYRIFFPTLALLFIISFHHCESSIMPAHGKILICEQSIRSNTMIFIYQLTSRYSNKNTHELLLICVLPFPLFFLLYPISEAVAAWRRRPTELIRILFGFYFFFASPLMASKLYWLHCVLDTQST